MKIKLKDLPRWHRDIEPIKFNNKDDAISYIDKLLDGKAELVYLDYNWHRKCCCGGNLIYHKAVHKWTYLHGSKIDIPTEGYTACEKCRLVYDASEARDEVVIYHGEGFWCRACRKKIGNGSPLFAFTKKKAGGEGIFCWNRYHRYYVCTVCGLVNLVGRYSTYGTVWRDGIYGGGRHVTEEYHNYVTVPLSAKEISDYRRS